MGSSKRKTATTNTPPPGTRHSARRGGKQKNANESENSGAMITPNPTSTNKKGKGGKGKRKSPPEDLLEDDEETDRNKRRRSDQIAEGPTDDGPVRGSGVDADADVDRQWSLMKLKLKQREDTIQRMESEASLISSKKYTQGKRRWGKRNLLSTDAASQQMINNFVKKHLFKKVKFLPVGFEKWSVAQKNICGMMMSTINVPSDRTKKEYWTSDIVPALVYKMQMAKNQRLQKMKVVFMRMYCQ